MTDRAMQRSAFCTRRGFFKFTRMPFGLKSAPRTFCRAMSTVMSALLWSLCIVYLDDVIVYATTQVELLERLNTVQTRLAQYGFKVKHPNVVSLGDKFNSWAILCLNMVLSHFRPSFKLSEIGPHRIASKRCVLSTAQRAIIGAL